MNNQGKTPQQYTDSVTFFMYAAILLFTLMLVMTLFKGCVAKPHVTKTHVITEWDGDREIRWYTTDSAESCPVEK